MSQLPAIPKHPGIQRRSDTGVHSVSTPEVCAAIRPPAGLKGLVTRGVEIRPAVVLSSEPVDLNIVLERMQQATGAAGTVALKLMTDPNVPAAVRLRAAEFVFDRALKGIETEDIEARVSELERAAALHGDRYRS